MSRVRVVAALAALAVAASAAAQVQIGVDNPLRTGEGQQQAVRVNDAIYLAYGFGNTFLVTTSAGNVVIDTCEPCGVNWLDPGELRRIAVAPYSPYSR